MGWDQTYYVESLQRFLTRLVDLDLDRLIAEEISRRMKEQHLSIANVEDIGSIDDMYALADPLMRITLSDGRVFVHKKVRQECGDDWGSEDWELRLESEEVVPEKHYHLDYLEKE
jgi:hypothetical protein